MLFMHASLDPQLLDNFSTQSENLMAMPLMKKSSKRKTTIWDTILMAPKEP